MRRLFSYARRYWLRYVFGILCTFANATLAMIIPLFIRDAINATGKHQPDLVAHYAGLMILFAVMLGTVRWFSRFVIFNVGRDVEYDLRNDLFKHLSTLGTDFYMKYKTGDLMSRMINDFKDVRMTLRTSDLTPPNSRQRSRLG